MRGAARKGGPYREGYQRLSEVLEHAEVAAWSDTLMTESRCAVLFPRTSGHILKTLTVVRSDVWQLGNGRQLDRHPVSPSSRSTRSRLSTVIPCFCVGQMPKFLRDVHVEESMIEFPREWIDGSKFEQILRRGPAPHECHEIGFRFPAGSKIMIDAAVRLLSLSNQLDRCTKRVSLRFDEVESGAMGYLNRMGFFDHLAKGIQVHPERPSYSGAQVYAGANAHLVEIARIHPQNRDDDLPTRLMTALVNGCSHRSDAQQLGQAAWTIFAELIDNIFSHSQTSLDGYAALQVYSRGNKVTVAVSDSGLGIMETLRPALSSNFPALTSLSDIELLVEIFRQGVSRHGADRGCGLKGSAAKAMKYRADLDVRLPQIRVLLTPGAGVYRPNTAYCYDSLPLIWGTHICFKFRLDTML